MNVSIILSLYMAIDVDIRFLQLFSFHWTIVTIYYSTNQARD